MQTGLWMVKPHSALWSARLKTATLWHQNAPIHHAPWLSFPDLWSLFLLLFLIKCSFQLKCTIYFKKTLYKSLKWENYTGFFFLKAVKRCVDVCLLYWYVCFLKLLWIYKSSIYNVFFFLLSGFKNERKRFTDCNK